MNDYQDSNSFRIKLSLGLIITLSEIAIILLNHDSPTWRQILIVAAIFALNIAFILFGLRQNRTHRALVESRKKEAHEHERLLTIINSIPDAILTVNPRGDIELFNSAALNLANTNSSLIEKNIHKVFKFTKITGEKFNLREVFRNGAAFFSTNNLIFESDGAKIRIELEVLLVRGFYSQKKSQKSFAVILRDITKQKTLDEERDEFISVVSHELRTPVAITEGAISNLQLMVEKNTPHETLKKTVDMTYKQITFLATMINDLSTLSRAERGIGEQREEISAKKLAEDLFAKYLSSAEEKGLKMNLNLGADLGSVKTSRLYIEELLQNLITNAIKYTREGKVEIDFRNSKDGKNVIFAVKDSGIGISKTEQAKVFEKFYRSEDWRTRETGGTGLGLYVSVKLANKLGTEIQLKSRLNHGSTFFFELPKLPEAE
ncbi:MAG: ATP-binding protein [bacterium]|nr:ATP-binding protein [bacterium]